MDRTGWILVSVCLGALVPSLCAGRENAAYSPTGMWRVVDAVDGGYVGSEDPDTAKYLKRCAILITKDRFQQRGDDGSTQEYKVVHIDAPCQPAAIDLLDSEHGITYRGIWKRDGKQLWICVQFVMEGDSKASVRP